jgi:MFS family permease
MAAGAPARGSNLTRGDLDRDGIALSDRRIVYAAAFVRAVATGLVGVLLGLYLAQVGLDPAAIGTVITAGLAGAALATAGVTVASRRRAARPLLVLLAVTAALGGLSMLVASTPSAIAIAAFVGMINGMGRDRGAALVLEQALLPATVSDERRTRAFAWYTVLQDVGHALGALAAGVPALLGAFAAIDPTTALRAALLLYVALISVTGLLYLGLSRRDVAPGELARSVSPATRRILWRISSLFALDSIGGGFLTAAMIALFFHERFGASEAAIGALFFAARIANAGSHLAAAWLAERIGLVNTMVFTHLPSSLLLATIAIAPSFPVAAALFVLREGLVEMDVPTRQSYVMAVVQPHERTVASGVTSLVRLGGWAAPPAVAGVLMQDVGLGAPLVVAAALKISYDLLLYRAFREVRPPEER